MWSDSDNCPIGLFHGASGIALFLLYCSLACGDGALAAVGRSALDFDLARRLPIPPLDTPTMPRSTQAGAPVVCYLEYGSAGVGSVALRYYFATDIDDYFDGAAGLLKDCVRKYALGPGHLLGLSGMTHYVLDWYDWTSEPSLLGLAGTLVDGIAMYRTRAPDGQAFPVVSDDNRLVADYGGGAAGIAALLRRYTSRLAAVPAEVGDHDFFLDNLILPRVADSHRRHAGSRIKEELEAFVAVREGDVGG